ncbi:MAG: hypothetical protein ACK2T3_02480 [Candidatus Promineifilaceae bacterium]
MSDNNRPTGVTVIAVLFIISAIPSLVGTVLFILEAFKEGFTTGPVVSIYTLLLGIVATLFYGVLALAAGWGLFSLKDWGRSLAIFVSVFLLFVIPVGTIIGAVVIWYLRKEEVRSAFPDSFMF